MAKRKRKNKSSMSFVIQLMEILHSSDTQVLIRLRSMIDDELIDRKIDLNELKMNRRSKFIKIIHWLKFGSFN